MKKNAVTTLLYRLDNDTTGLVLIARNQKTFDYFQQLQVDEKLMKTYLAICSIESENINLAGVNIKTIEKNPKIIGKSINKDYLEPFSIKALDNCNEELFGTSPTKLAKIDIPIAHSHKSSKRMIAVLKPGYKYKGKEIKTLTLIRIIKKKNNTALIEAKIMKGCRHQIRLHLKSIGFPIIGDKLYGNKKFRSEDMKLHCYKVEQIE